MCESEVWGIELVDWATINNSGKIWFCSDIRLSKMLHDTVERVLTTKCMSSHQVGFLNAKKIADRWSPRLCRDRFRRLCCSRLSHKQFRVVFRLNQQHFYQGALPGHLQAFNRMQYARASFTKMMQYRNIRSWTTTLSIKSIRNQFCFDSLSANALDSMNFKRQYIKINFSNNIEFGLDNFLFKSADMDKIWERHHWFVRPKEC